MANGTIASAGTETPLSGVLDDSEFDLDLRVVEAGFPMSVPACDTSDNCGASCGSACATNVADPS